MKNILITNNKLVYEGYKDSIDVVYDEKYLYLDILKIVRDKIHMGHKLLTHPLSGSIKPNETPYKSIILSKKAGDFDEIGLNLVEESIQTTEKFLKNEETPNWSEKVLHDFRTIDLSLIAPVMEKINCNL